MDKNQLLSKLVEKNEEVKNAMAQTPNALEYLLLEQQTNTYNYVIGLVFKELEEPKASVKDEAKKEK